MAWIWGFYEILGLEMKKVEGEINPDYLLRGCGWGRLWPDFSALNWVYQGMKIEQY